MSHSAELKQAAEGAVNAGNHWGRRDSFERQLAKLATPEAVLALIAENERLTKQWGDRPAYRTPEYESKRDAMWRRAHMVATSKGYDHINMAIAAAPSACADCMGCGGEWRGEGIPNSVCETCKGSRGKALEEERDRLKAENETLRKYGEEFAVLAERRREEVETLRKERDARHPFKPFHEPAIGFTGCVICGVYTDHGGLPCPKTRAAAIALSMENQRLTPVEPLRVSHPLDAALGQGEQS